MADPKKINYAGGQTIDNSELVDKKINDAVNPVSQAVANEVTRAQGAENTLDSKITDVAHNLATETSSRQAADNALANKIGDLANLETVAKTNIVAAVNEVLGKIPESQIIDDHLDENSEHAVQNKAIVEGIADAIEPLQDAIDELSEHVPLDPVPTEGSEKGVKSGGVFDAIRFASVKVGETMFWPISEAETREVHSDNPFNFEVNGTLHSVTTEDDSVEMCISKDIPDGWHALDGKAELTCSEYPELAKFFGGTKNDDGSWNNDGNNVADDWIKVDGIHSKSFNARIWLPYVQQKIIKAKY